MFHEILKKDKDDPLFQHLRKGFVLAFQERKNYSFKNLKNFFKKIIMRFSRKINVEHFFFNKLHIG
jgi:hypothetical protein